MEFKIGYQYKNTWGLNYTIFIVTSIDKINGKFTAIINSTNKEIGLATKLNRLLFL